MTLRSWRIPLAMMVALVAMAVVVHAADKKGRRSDAIWTAPDLAARHVRSIAMFPVATYDHNLEIEKLAAGMWGQAIKGAGYRWVSVNSVRAMIAGGDSMVAVHQQTLLRNPRLDSLVAAGLCAQFRTSGILTVRVDRWEQQQVEWDQSGKPTTTVQITAALVDSTGRLLWSASGSEVGEGPYHDPTTNPIAVTSGGLGQQPVTGQGGPPAYADVAQRLFARWAVQFPALTSEP
jgi:hypothetical protein